MDITDKNLLNWKRISWIIVFIFLVGYFTSKIPSFSSNKAELQKYMKEYSSTNYPIHLANGFVLDSMTLTDSNDFTIYFSNAEHIIPASDYKKLDTLFHASLNKNVNNERMKYFIENNIDFVYHFTDANGNVLYSFTLDPGSKL